MKFEKLLVATDFSATADTAITHAVDIARHTGAGLMLLHVCPVVESSAYGHKGDTAKREEMAKNREELEAMRESLSGQGVEISHAIIDDAPYKGILQAAEESDVDLVVVGTRGLSGLERLLLGSVAERVLRGSNTSVLIARERTTPRGGYRRIMVPVDFSSNAGAVLAAAAAVVAGDGEIEVHHYWNEPVFGPVLEVESTRAEIRVSTYRQGQLLMEPYQGNEYGIRFTASVGSPKKRILEALDKNPYDLVVMGSHGHHGLERWLLGSVAEAVARHARASVLVVKEREYE